MAHAHLSNINLKYSKYFSCFIRELQYISAFKKKKCLLSWVVNTKHTNEILSTEGYIEKAALLLRHMTAFKVTVLQVSHSSSFFFQQINRHFMFSSVAEESLQSASSVSQNRKLIQKLKKINFYVILIKYNYTYSFKTT